ncbi:MAG: GNAT family N-acetyltransferase [Bacteroidota bacterium]
MKFFVETSRFILREFRMEDAAGFLSLESDPEVLRYIGTPPVTDIKKIQEIISHVRQQYQDNGIGRWVIVNKENEEIVGWTGLKLEKEIRPEKPYYDLGYRLKRKYWGQGIATETALVSLDYGFKQLGLTEIFAGAHVDNIGSNRVLNKLGMELLEQFTFEEMLCNWYGMDANRWNEQHPPS